MYAIESRAASSQGSFEIARNTAIVGTLAPRGTSLLLGANPYVLGGAAYVATVGAACYGSYQFSDKFIAPKIASALGSFLSGIEEKQSGKAMGLYRQRILEQRQEIANSMTFTEDRIKHMFKASKGRNHAIQFDPAFKNYNPANGAALRNTIRAFITCQDTRRKSGAYHGMPGTNYFNTQSNMWVFVTSSNEFYVGWELFPSQLPKVIATGNLP